MRSRARGPATIASLLLCLCGACAAGRGEPSGPGPVARAPKAESGDKPATDSGEPWRGGTEIRSNDGTWTVVYKTPDGPIPRGESFAIEAWVFEAGQAPDPSRSKPRTDVSLAVDAGMPQHGHGMNLVPKIEKLEGGRFRVEGLLFHMPGKWQLYFDVGSGPLVERAQADVEVE